MHERVKHHDFSHPVDTLPPKVAVVIVYHREPDNAMLLEAIESVNQQSYPNIECITVDNRFAGMSYGTARDLAVANSDADLVLFLAEEDMLTPDTVSSMVGLYQIGKQQADQLVHITTGVMLRNEAGAQALSTLRAPGMYERQWLAAEPFGDTAWPDRDKQQQMASLATVRGALVSFGCTHHFGYVLRLHPFRRDGIQVKAA